MQLLSYYAVNSGMMMGVIVVFSPWRKRGQKALWRWMRDSNEAEYRLKRLVLIPLYRPEADFAR